MSIMQKIKMNKKWILFKTEVENKRHPGLLTICKNYAEKKKRNRNAKWRRIVVAFVKQQWTEPKIYQVIVFCIFLHKKKTMLTEREKFEKISASN